MPVEALPKKLLFQAPDKMGCQQPDLQSRKAFFKQDAAHLRAAGQAMQMISVRPVMPAGKSPYRVLTRRASGPAIGYGPGTHGASKLHVQNRCFPPRRCIKLPPLPGQVRFTHPFILPPAVR